MLGNVYAAPETGLENMAVAAPEEPEGGQNPASKGPETSGTGENPVPGKSETSGEEEQELPDEYFQVLELVGKYFSKDISLKRSPAGKGTMTIRFDSDQEIQKFLKALNSSNI